MFLTNKTFWLDTAERAIKTVAQTLVALLLASGDALNILTIDWQTALGVAGGAGVVSVLTSVASYKVGDKGTASLVVSEPKENTKG